MRLVCIILVSCSILNFVCLLLDFCSGSLLDGGNLSPPLLEDASKDLAPIHRLLIIWRIRPHWQHKCGLCSGSPGVAHQQQVRPPPVWLPSSTFLLMMLGLAAAHFLTCPMTVLHWFNPQPPQIGHTKTIW